MNRTHLTTSPQPRRGAALLVFMVLFLIASAMLVLGITRSVYDDVVAYRVLADAKVAYYGLDGAIEDTIHRHRHSLDYSSPSETYEINGVDVDITRTLNADQFDFDLTATLGSITRNGFLTLTLGSGASFSYGLQSDIGGIIMENSSSVIGNIYGNGTVVGTGGGSGNLVTGSVVSAGPGGLVDGVHATGSVWSHAIDSSTIDEDAHVWATSTITATVVGGTIYTDEPDQPTSTLPFSDEEIDEFKNNAEAGGVIASTSPECSGGTYLVDSDTSLGPVKIECDLIVEKSSTKLTLLGNVWVEGNITTKNGPTIEMDSSLTGKTVPLVADNEANRMTSSRIVLQNSARFVGAGEDSYILLISQNNDEEAGGPEVAINSQQSSEGDVLLYAGHGEILIEQSGEYVAVTGRLIRLQNSAQIVYESGAINLEFPAGPAGGYIISAWDEVE